AHPLGWAFFVFGFCDFNVIAVLSSLFPSLRYPLFVFSSQLLLILFSVLLFSGELNSGLVWAQSCSQNRPQTPEHKTQCCLTVGYDADE
ncbi:hypothetical protein, partial [Plesiomonas shigelloides]|uniref:hypothetical protein n=1 Tax=Plesiomonas shigelloides TaxID=703 RepID=UPI00387F37D2